MNYETGDAKLTLILERPGKKPVVMALGLGREYAHVPQKLPEFLPIAPTFKSACILLKRRQLTLDGIREASKLLGLKLADFLDDEGGWHGEGRREQTEEFPVRGP